MTVPINLLTLFPRPSNSNGSGTALGCKFATTSTAPRTWSHLATCSSSAPPNRVGAFFMRILYCNKYNFPFSGTEVYLFELMELMRSHGHEVALFSMADPRGEPTAYDHHFVPQVD